MARVCTYLNFQRNTEEAFNFYQCVFGGEFTGGGVGRFKDVPMPEGAPAMAEEDLNLIMHIELNLLGVHALMGTDAPESFGFNVVQGNNVHINGVIKQIVVSEKQAVDKNQALILFN
jgi:PhnB protein